MLGLLFLRLFVLMFRRSIYSIRWLFIIVVVRLIFSVCFFSLSLVSVVLFLYIMWLMCFYAFTIEYERTNEPIENNERASNNLCSTKPKTIHLKSPCTCMYIYVNANRMYKIDMFFLLYIKSGEYNFEIHVMPWQSISFSRLLFCFWFVRWCSLLDLISFHRLHTTRLAHISQRMSRAVSITLQ